MDIANGVDAIATGTISGLEKKKLASLNFPLKIKELFENPGDSWSASLSSVSTS